MSEIITIKEKPLGGYIVSYENRVVLGHLLMKEDGFYDFWPEIGGFWPAYLLRAIADKMDEMNAPFDKELEAYFRNQEKTKI
jgi:hypothetical protein